MGESEVDFEFLYPNLIVFLGPNNNKKLLQHLTDSFKEFQYGPLRTSVSYKNENGQHIRTCRILQGSDVCLAVGEGSLPCDAEERAVQSLLEKLCDKFYVIQANPVYFTKKKMPPFALSGDLEHSHIYRVVFLENNELGVPFPHPVTGEIDYVEDYKSLLKYIVAHAKSNSKADLFILNILKKDRALVKKACQSGNMSVQPLVGCSDMGMFAYYKLTTRMILKDLLEAGGKTIKYKLIGPRPQFSDDNGILTSVVKKETADTNQSERSTNDEEEIVINPWIADHLVIMEVVSEFNELESTREIIWQSVKDCADTMEFIIENKTSKTGMIYSEAMIDRNVVGRARGYDKAKLKIEAAENAMHHLKKCCFYIQAKESYFGSQYEMPQFLREPHNPAVMSDTYRFAENKGWPPVKVLKRFLRNKQEDIYFMQDFTETDKNVIYNTAKRRGLLVRWIGPVLCVSKKRKPDVVMRELLPTLRKENEKYKLIVPPSKIIQLFKGGETQDWNNYTTSQDTQTKTEPISGGQENYNSPSVTNTQSDYSETISRGKEYYNSPSVMNTQSDYSETISRGQEYNNSPSVTNSQSGYSEPTSRGKEYYNSPSVMNTRSEYSEPISRDQEYYNSPYVKNTQPDYSETIRRGQEYNNSPSVMNSQSDYSEPTSRGKEYYNSPSVMNTRSEYSEPISRDQEYYNSPYVKNTQSDYSETISRGQQYYNSPLVTNTQSDYSETIRRGQEYPISPLVTNTESGYSETISRGQEYYHSPSDYSDHETPHADSGPQGGGNETPSWVMNYIKSSPIKKCKPHPQLTASHPVNPPRQKDDVYSRYKFIAPKTATTPVPTSNERLYASDQRPDDKSTIDYTKPFQQNDALQPNASEEKRADHKPTLSERLTQKLLNMCEKQKHQSDSREPTCLEQGNKRSYDYLGNTKEESEYSNKFSKRITDSSGISQHSSSFEYTERTKYTSDSTDDQTQRISDQRNVSKRESDSWSKNGYDGSFAESHSFEEDGSSNGLNRISQATTAQQRNTYGEEPYVKQEFSNNSSQLFCRRPTAQNWTGDNKRQYDQRPTTSAGGRPDITSLFDLPPGVECQGPRRPEFPLGPPGPWKKDKKFRGHNFSKLAKYGKKPT